MPPKFVPGLVFAFSGRYQYRIGERYSLEVNPGRGEPQQRISPPCSEGGIKRLSLLILQSA
jgi:hypothetical protein